MDAIHKIAKDHNLIVIEDAAHALGAEYKGNRIGSMSDMTTFSFHPVKHITTAEGGMVMTNNKELYDKLILFRTHGITRDPELLSRDEGSWYYEQIALGYNYRITDVQCALGVSQMRRLDDFVAKRREIAKRYDKAFAANPNIVVPFQKEGCNNSYHLYVIQVKNVNRRQVFEELRALGIGVNVHYIPVYTFPYYREHGYETVTCKHAEELYENIISIPMYPDLTLKQQEYVIEKIIELCK